MTTTKKWMVHVDDKNDSDDDGEKMKKEKDIMY